MCLCAGTLYTEIYLQLTAQYIILMIIHVLAMLCYLSAVHGESPFTADKLRNMLHESSSTVGF